MKNQFIGHERQINFLRKITSDNNLAQAYIFSGPEKIGKFTLAKFWAQSLIYQKPLFAGEKLVFSDDLLIITPLLKEKGNRMEEKDISVKTVREMSQKLSLYPGTGEKRVLIIDQAQRLTVEAQNALLKNMEEPNDTSLIILITHKEKDILDTVKSRCQIVNFSLVPTSVMLKAGWDKETVYFSMGRPGIARELKDNAGRKKEYQETFQDLQNLLQRNFPVFQRFQMAEKYALDKTVLINRLNFWIWILWLRAYREADFQLKKSLYLKIESIEKSLEKITDSNVNFRLETENLILNL